MSPQANLDAATEITSISPTPAQPTSTPVASPRGAAACLRAHWPEYAMEASLLGTFMVSACLFGILYELPSSPIHQLITSGLIRRLLGGVAMGLTAIAIIYSPWGKQSGAHINPSTTLTFFRLGKIQGWDAVFYICAQFLGSALGVAIVAVLIPALVSHPAVRYVVTVPGSTGIPAAFAAEVAISFLLMAVVLTTSNSSRLSSYTGLFAGLMVATYITMEAPISGMSMNPARTFGSAVSANVWTALWIYFTAPPLGMLAAAELYLWRRGNFAVKCCKYHHNNSKRCIFCGANGGYCA